MSLTNDDDDDDDGRYLHLMGMQEALWTAWIETQNLQKSF